MSIASRRSFLHKSVKLACLPLLATAMPAFAAGTETSQTDLLSRMQWMNNPPLAHIEGDTLSVHSTPKGDCYRMPGWIIDTANFFHLPVKDEFTFEARVHGRFVSTYDQVGLMVRQDTENWLKCGTEYFDGQRHASVVFTRQWSDWSTMKDLTETVPEWWRVVRRKDSVEVLCSLDGKAFTSVRQAYGYFVSTPRLEVGIYCASTQGQGVHAIFDSLKLSAL